MNILLIVIGIVIFALAVYFINKRGNSIDQFYKKDIDSHISMHHDPNRGRRQK